MPSYPKVSIVIVNWNKKDYAINLLNSLRDINYDNYEITVVDNASEDGSVETIKEKFPEINLIVNSRNLGGTGGFNTGIRHALEKGGYKYIWLLDNDAMVEKDTLVELVKAMEKDESIGIAGSMIINPDNKELIVELGLNIDWDTGIVKPFMENYRISEVKDGIYDVDYVAACSALVRADLFLKMGLIDERYFIWWDDTDLGLSVRKTGKKVAGVTKSIVYHPTEKDWPPIHYYNNRNSLLAFSKHADLGKRVKIFYRIASYSSKGILFFYLNKNKYLSNLLYYSIKDFLMDRWREFKRDTGKWSSDKSYESRKADFLKGNKILLLPTGNHEKISNLVNLIKNNYETCCITLLIQHYRKNLFEKLPIDSFILYNDKTKYIFFEHTILFLKLLARNFDISITPNEISDSPFAYASKKYYAFSETDRQFKLRGMRKDAWKIVLATIVGQIVAIPLTLILIVKSLKYSHEKR
ncbi:MAG: hypothetical protein C4291_09265 [Candidatus Dadabacteria bacterium]